MARDIRLEDDREGRVIEKIHDRIDTAGHSPALFPQGAVRRLGLDCKFYWG